MRIGLGAWALGALVSSGCFEATPEPVEALYSGAALPRAQVAALHGDIESVDDQRITTQHHSFELLPGCHTVTNSKTWGHMESSSGMIAHLPEIPFAIDMRAGGTYVVRIIQTDSTGSGGSLSISALELDDNGKTVREFQPNSRCAGG